MKTFLGMFALAFAIAAADTFPLVSLCMILAVAMFCLWEVVS